MLWFFFDALACDRELSPRISLISEGIGTYGGAFRDPYAPVVEPSLRL